MMYVLIAEHSTQAVQLIILCMLATTLRYQLLYGSIVLVF